MKSNFFHKYIKNASTHGMILTEYLLNAGKKPQTTERARKSPCKLGSRKKKENNKVRKDESGRVLHPRKGAVKEERFLYPGRPPHRQRGWLGQNGSFRASEENAAARAEGALHRQAVSPSCTPPPETHTHRCRMGLGAETQASDIRPGRGLGMAMQKQPRLAGT